MTNTLKVNNLRILYWLIIEYEQDGDNVICSYDFLDEHYKGVGVSKEESLENMCEEVLRCLENC
jgi:DNA polymerase III epsilon subunit-like protein